MRVAWRRARCDGGWVEKVLLYDGDCGFCTRAAGVLARWSGATTAVVAAQEADLGALGVTEERCAVEVVFVGPTGISGGPYAVRDYLQTGALGWRVVARVAINRVTRPVAERAYRFVARHRHQLPPRTCSVSR